MNMLVALEQSHGLELPAAAPRLADYALAPGASFSPAEKALAAELLPALRIACKRASEATIEGWLKVLMAQRAQHARSGRSAREDPLHPDRLRRPAAGPLDG